MLFWLKKGVSFWLMPLSVCLVLMCTGLWCLRSERRARLGRGLSIAGVLLLLVFSHNRVSYWLVRSLETSYAAIPELRIGEPVPTALGRCRYVVVLGGGHGDVAGLSATNRLSPNALARLVEGVRLLRALPPEAKLIVSGPAVGRNPSHAAVLAQAARALGVAPERMLEIETARDTEDEAYAVRTLVGDVPVALVTSAWHLPRAAALFRKAGVDALPCPTDFLAKPNPEWRWNDVLFDSGSLDKSTLAVRERIGRLWTWLRGKS